MKKRVRGIFFLFFVLLGGFKMFSQTTTPWSKQENFPSGVLEKSAVFVINNNAFAGLGTNNSSFRKDLWRFSPEKNKWEQMEDFPAQPRISVATFSIGNKGYVGTGMIGSENTKQGTDDFWEYNADKNAWTQKAKFPGGIRYAAIGFSTNGKGYIGLGANQNTFYNDLWEYDPSTNRWSKKADFPDPGKVDASVFVIGNEAYITGGQKKELFVSKKTSWKYSCTKNEWKQFSEFPGPARVGAIAFSYKTRGYVTTGSNGTIKRFADFWEYNSATDSWRQTDDAPFGSSAYGFAFVIGNNAYINPDKTQVGSSGSELWKYELPEIQNAANSLVVGGSLLLGTERVPLAGVEIKITNTKGEVVKSVFSNLFGSFLFTGLPENQDLIFTFAATDPGWKNENFYLVNRKNETVAVLNKDNQFKFYLSSAGKNKIALIRVENKNLRMNMKGKLAIDNKEKTPLGNIAVSLLNDDQEIVQGGTTDENGIFVFTYLPVDSSVYLSIDEKAAKSLAKGAKIVLLDEGDNVVNKTNTAHAEFQLTNLPPEKNTLSSFYMEDPWIEAMSSKKNNDIHLVEHVYFDYNKWEILPEAKIILNKAVVVLKSNPKFSIEVSAYTDSRGEAKYNMELSEKRAAAAKDYMVSRGVSANQISAKGYGETKLVNRCKDGVPCTEEEHAQNRRMEFIIKRK